MKKWLSIKCKQLKWIIIQPVFRHRTKKDYKAAILKSAEIKAKYMALTYDYALIEGVKGKRKFMHFRGLMVKPEFIYNNHKDREGFESVNLEYVRREMQKRGINYVRLDVEEVYEAMGD